MSISCISDIHVKSPGDSAYKLLLKFMDHEKVALSESVAFLGDVFDHLTGEHAGYLDKFPAFFQRVEDLLRTGKQVYFFEGNHDFHFEKTFKKRLLESLSERQVMSFHYIRGSLALDLGGRKHLFFHGDLLDSDNLAYMRWKKIYSSKVFGFFISNFIPFSFVEKIGERASSNSRKRGQSSFDFSKAKEKYRNSAKLLAEERKVDCLIGGHTHIRDDYFWEDKAYHNIGYPLEDKSFLFVGNNGVERMSLE